jgi:hypothetical protein
MAYNHLISLYNMSKRPVILGYEDYDLARYITDNSLTIPLSLNKTEDHSNTEQIVFNVPIYTTTT